MSKCKHKNDTGRCTWKNVGYRTDWCVLCGAIRTGRVVWGKDGDDGIRYSYCYPKRTKEHGE